VIDVDDLEAARVVHEAMGRLLSPLRTKFIPTRAGFLATCAYPFAASATARLKGIRDEQQALIKQDKAAPCDTKWSVGGSAAEGKKTVKQQAKLMLRAFNGECDAAIAQGHAAWHV
jgi:hypothetical protein